MSNVDICTSILMGVAFLVSEILLLINLAKFSFRTNGPWTIIVHGSEKIESMLKFIEDVYHITCLLYRE